MPDKPNTNKKNNQIEQVSQTPDEIRTANAALGEAIAMADKSIAEAQDFIDKKIEGDIDDVVNFLVDTCVKSSARAISESDGMKAVEEELDKYLTNSTDILKYKDKASQICNTVLQSVFGGSDDRSITVSAFLNFMAKELNGAGMVEVTIDGSSKYSSLGILLNKGVKMYVDGSAGDDLARYLSGGEVKLNGDVHGSSTAAVMKSGVLDIYGTVKWFGESAFASSNKGKIYLNHPTHGQVLIYDGIGITAGNFTPAAKGFFDIKYHGFYMITPKV